MGKRNVAECSHHPPTPTPQRHVPCNPLRTHRHVPVPSVLPMERLLVRKLPFKGFFHVVARWVAGWVGGWPVVGGQVGGWMGGWAGIGGWVGGWTGG